MIIPGANDDSNERSIKGVRSDGDGVKRRRSGRAAAERYFVSLCAVRLLHQWQNFLYSTRPVCFFLFFVVE
jgi:hypothetical protein